MALRTQSTTLYVNSAANTMTAITETTSVDGIAGARDQIDTTNFASTEREYLAGFANPSPVQIGLNWDPINTTHRTLETLYTAGTPVIWVIGLADGTAPPTIAGSTVTYPTTRSYMTFTGYISEISKTLGTNDAVRATLSIQRSGPVTYNYKT